LEEIERNDYDVFTKHAFVKNSKKIQQLPQVWFNSMFG